MPVSSVSVPDHDRAVRALVPALHALTDGQRDALGSVLGALTSL
ncbi:hypothetical protein HD597_004583 [Nonomuraea thailandensis]|uniref:Uncharacterized protein n=1 Tax=Nonomuraea thailandensis TaxID=1188745 RepID=A0A9X2K236_9ACTN|nr:hypothetical protein [Nonomuraea thailandensis]MCP2357563.1 hypothetical protein [Nonomuraea thailandensis]